MAVSEAPTLPPLDRMFHIGIWVETILYGMNILIYGAAILVLSRRFNDVTQRNARVLIVVSSVAFALSTAYVAVSFRQLLEVFIYGPPGMASLYFANEASTLPQAKLGLYTVNVCLQDLILIWRLWTVFGKRHVVVVVLFILEGVRLSSSIAAMVRGGQPGVPIFDPLVHKMGIVNWTFDLALNIGVTLLIAYRLWSVGHAVSSLTLSAARGCTRNKYTDIIFTIIESGSLFAAATLVTVSLYLSGSIATVVAIDSVAQLATVTPLLIVVRVGLGLTHGNPLARGAGSTATVDGTGSVPGGSMTFARRVQINVTKTSRTEDGGEEYPLSEMPSIGSKWMEMQN